ncbi:ABC transporter ATP-binding protein [Clostridium oryzae]|uniref:Putative ABC transporter ATP-binding protein YxlF n=1 Tax=Clostridium oryzae TaxID=1450648 RepID=A0A1V4IXR6_9CLOT|nr:ABC transporter ATP-binding protein [Clostridium oryzae]OPJ64620.1 putative ABC transporter ATP-binding protein YxlF [Clostridium oryzae]
MEYAIKVENLKKSFQSLEVIKKCSLSVRSNEIYGFLGSNGAGKTTVFKMMVGFLHKDAGSIHILGLETENHRNEVLRNVGISIETPVFYEHLSAQENLKIHLAYMNAEADIDQALSMVGLGKVDYRPVSKFSLGMRARLAIARAMIHNPQILILDEPINGLDPQGIRDMRELFKKLTGEYDKTILLSSHALSEVEYVADTVGILVNGTVARQAKMKDIKKQYSKGLEEYYFEAIKGVGINE